MCTKGSGTNSVMLPVRCCRSRMAMRWRAQFLGPSTWPNIMVAVVLSPTSCAVSITYTDEAHFVESLNVWRDATCTDNQVAAARYPDSVTLGMLLLGLLH